MQSLQITLVSPCQRAKEGRSWHPSEWMTFKAIPGEHLHLVTRTYRQFSSNACSADGGISLSRTDRSTSDSYLVLNWIEMSTEIRNWEVVAKAMEATGATSSQMYQRAKALAQGKLDPMPTSFPEAPYSISAVLGWSRHTTNPALQRVPPSSPEAGHNSFRSNSSSTEVLWPPIRPSSATQSDIETHPVALTKTMFTLQMQWKHKI